MFPSGTMTKVGALGLLLATVGKALTDVSAGTFGWDQLPVYVGAISAALAALGLRRAIATNGTGA